VFEAQIKLDEHQASEAAQLAYRAMLGAARALVRVQNIDVTDDADQIVAEFRARFFDTKLFFDPFAGPKFANYLLAAYDKPPNGESPGEARRRQRRGERVRAIRAESGCEEERDGCEREERAADRVHYVCSMGVEAA